MKQDKKQRAFPGLQNSQTKESNAKQKEAEGNEKKQRTEKNCR